MAAKSSFGNSFGELCDWRSYKAGQFQGVAGLGAEQFDVGSGHESEQVMCALYVFLPLTGKLIDALRMADLLHW